MLGSAARSPLEGTRLEKLPKIEVPYVGTNVDGEREAFSRPHCR
jgi:hypothetical protein